MAKKLYAIINGNNGFSGIVDDWSIAEPLVKGAKKVLYKSFSNLTAAQDWMDVNEVKEENKMEKINVNTNGLNDGQKAAVEAFVDFMGSNELCMSLSGYAGTGKTFTLGRISEAMKAARIPVAFIAPTNKAVVVMAKNGIEASTVHKFVYKYEVDNGRYIKTRRDGREFNHGLIVMDESSMANDEILRDLEEYAERAACKILYVGDPGQLPPVGDNNKRRVFNEFNAKGELTQVMRQANGSRILDLATAIRNGNLIVPAVSDKDVAVVKSEVAFDNYVQKLREGKDATFVVFRNDTRVATNLKVRAVLGLNGKPQNGEKFIAINNTERLANGEEFTELGAYVGEIIIDGAKGYVYEAPSSQESLFEDIPSDSKKLIVILPTFAGASFSMPKNVSGECAYIFEQYSGRYGDYCTIRRGYEVVVATFAYAITGHKSQGSQWDFVFVEEVSSREAVKWFYTVVTRAAKGLVLSKNIKYGARSWKEIEKAAYGEEVTAETAPESTIPTAPVVEVKQQFASVPKKWTVKYFDNYEMF